MKVSISPEVFKEFHPQLRIAFILIKGINNHKNLRESEHLLKEGEELARMEFHPETLKNHNLIAPWVAAQKEFGSKAKHYHTSVERLLQNVLHKKSITAKDTLTNLINYLSLQHVVPIGVDDLKKIKGNLHFELSKGKDKVHLLARIKKGAFIYRDNSGVIGTKFDYWKSVRTAVDKETKSALIHLEVVPPLTKKELEDIMIEMQSLIDSFCGGKSKVFILDRNCPSCEI
ncbi:MAG: phenylalanine--tRNA ligase beta subunit-related protein [Nanoarchaeota archaeon]